ncbi:MAG: hypothetical protein LBU73_01450 [Helicobacteraceae bacterium]|jgi:hypothetical protein|nr:hypothetical protein [Helicobacteraceae bacterium]
MYKTLLILLSAFALLACSNGGGDSDYCSDGQWMGYKDSNDIFANFAPFAYPYEREDQLQGCGVFALQREYRSTVVPNIDVKFESYKNDLYFKYFTCDPTITRSDYYGTFTYYRCAKSDSYRRYTWEARHYLGYNSVAIWTEERQ